MSVIGHHYPTLSLSRPNSPPYFGPVLRVAGFVLGMTAVLLALMAIRVLSVADTMPSVARAIFG